MYNSFEYIKWNCCEKRGFPGDGYILSRQHYNGSKEMCMVAYTLCKRSIGPQIGKSITTVFHRNIFEGHDFDAL
jgi:hypothetical protein